MGENQELTIVQKLILIQQSLQAPKDLINDFGGFNYRSAEGILSALKPLLIKYGCCVVFDDEIVVVDGRYYIKSVARLIDKGISPIAATGWAREPEHRTKSDDAQVTGASTSYAHKYALGALFAIDDASQDVDAISPQNAIGDAKPKKQHSKADIELWDAIKAFAEFRGSEPKGLAERIKLRNDYDGSDESKSRIAEELRSMVE